MNQTVNQTVRKLNNIHQAVIIVLVALMLAVMFGLLGLSTGETLESVVAERYAIGLTLIAIPVSLKLFADKIKKIRVGEGDMEGKVERFRKSFYMRISILSAVGCANILLYSITQNSNFMWLAAITFIAFAFCRTSTDELAGVVAEKEEEADGDE